MLTPLSAPVGMFHSLSQYIFPPFSLIPLSIAASSAYTTPDACMSTAPSRLLPKAKTWGCDGEIIVIFLRLMEHFAHSGLHCLLSVLASICDVIILKPAACLGAFWVAWVSTSFPQSVKVRSGGEKKNQALHEKNSQITFHNKAFISADSSIMWWKLWPFGFWCELLLMCVVSQHLSVLNLLSSIKVLSECVIWRINVFVVWSVYLLRAKGVLVCVCVCVYACIEVYKCPGVYLWAYT